VAPVTRNQVGTAARVATDGVKRHGISGGTWYDDRVNRGVCGRALTGLERLLSGQRIAITCGSCVRIMTVSGE
jgi:hypothetical protein